MVTPRPPETRNASTSFVTHPGRIFRIFWNFLRGRETSKMESFLHETKRKFTMRFRKKDKAAGATAGKERVSA